MMLEPGSKQIRGGRGQTTVIPLWKGLWAQVIIACKTIPLSQRLSMQGLICIKT